MQRLGWLLALALCRCATCAYFRIDCIDGETGRGVPLVQLKTASYISYYSDSAGVVAFDEPGLLGQTVYFVVLSDGYTLAHWLPGTPNSEPGVLVDTSAGGRATVVLNRTQPGQRMFRMTGGGLYRDSVLVGAPVPVADPLIGAANVLGQDSLLAAVYKKRAYYFFGDSECPAGPRDTDCQHYGRFTTGAWSCVPSADPNCTVPASLHYFASSSPNDPGGMAPDGRPNRQLIRIWDPHGFTHPKPMLPGPLLNESTWIGSVAVIKQGSEERMYTTFVCPSPGGAQGIAQWDDEHEQFTPVLNYPSLPGIQWVMGLAAADAGYVYYANPFANNRVAATFDAIINVSAYETFTPCDSPDCTTMSDWRWRPATSSFNNVTHNPLGWHSFGPQQERSALQSGRLAPENARYQVIDVATARPMLGGLARGSVNWNPYANKYILIADKGMDGGPSSESNYGELWYCEAPAVTGPWRECVRVISHAGTGTSCYNPLQLQFLDEDGGKAVYVACTFTSMWSSQKKQPKDRSCAFSDYGGQGCRCQPPASGTWAEPAVQRGSAALRVQQHSL